MAAANAPVLAVRGLGKKLARDLSLARRYGLSDILRDLRFGGPAPTTRPGEFWALRDVSFEVWPGEALGVIGHNGAGKSTLLRTLHGISRPDAGSIEICGRHAALLDLGAPFNKVLTGRENIETAAAVHGMQRAEVGSLIDAVADFSELEDVLDAPMWSYSTGMQMRLGYAVAAQLDAPLLLVDEVIAVGDIAFQRKCVSHIRRHLSGGGSLVVVSHDLWMVQALCQRCLVLDEGRVVADGTPNRAISTYLNQARQAQAFAPRPRAGFTPATPRSGSLATVAVRACHGPDSMLRNGDDMIIELEASTGGPPVAASWYVDLLTANRQVCVARLRPPADTAPLHLSAKVQVVRFVLPGAPLFPGSYYLAAHLDDPVDGAVLGVAEEPFPFEVESRHQRIDTLAQFAGALSSVATRYAVEVPAAGQ